MKNWIIRARDIALAVGITAVVAILASLPQVRAAVSVNQVVTTQTPKNGLTSFIQGTDTAGTYKTLYTGGANGSKIKGIFVTSNDGSASHLVTVQLSSSTTQHCATLCYGGAAVTVSINSGFANGTGAVNFMSQANWPGLPLDAQGNPYLYLSGNTQTIEATFATSLTASDQIGVTVLAEDF